MSPDEVPTFLEAFKENPLWIFLAFALGAFALMGVFAGIFTLQKSPSISLVFGVAVIVVGLMAIGAGIVGSTFEHRRRDLVLTVDGLSARDKERIAASSDGIASWYLVAGFGASALPVLLGVVLIVVASSKKRSLWTPPM